MRDDEGLAFDVSEYEARIASLKVAMSREKYDAVVCFSPASICYYCGYEGYSYNEEQFLLVCPDRAAGILVIRDIDESLARGPARRSHCSEVIVYRYPVEDPATILWMLLRTGRYVHQVGLESSAMGVSGGFMRRIADAGSGVAILDSTSMISAPRLLKRPAEWEYINEASDMAARALEQCLGNVRSGMTEIDFAGEIEYQLRLAGSEESASPTLIESGVRTVAAHSTPTRRIMKQGEPVRFAFAAVRRRYHVTTYQPIHFGQPSGHYEQYLRSCQEAFQVLLDNAGPGRRVRDACEKSRDVLRKYGVAHCNMGRYGYGVGIAFPPGWSEPYAINEHSDAVFAPGMTFCLHITMSVPEHGFGFTFGANYSTNQTGLVRTNRTAPALVVI